MEIARWREGAGPVERRQEHDVTVGRCPRVTRRTVEMEFGAIEARHKGTQKPWPPARLNESPWPNS
jgi:hypothetical protein